MNYEEKIIIACAFRYVSINDLEDLPLVLDVITTHIDSFETDQLHQLLDDIHFSLQYIGNQAKKMEHMREFGNNVQQLIFSRKKEECLYQKQRGTKEMTFFGQNTEICRCLFALSIAYAAPKRTIVFSMLDDLSKPYLNKFPASELDLIARACCRAYPNSTLGNSSNQEAVMDFASRVKEIASQKEEESPAETCLMKTHFAKVVLEEAAP